VAMVHSRSPCDRHAKKGRESYGLSTLLRFGTDRPTLNAVALIATKCRTIRQNSCRRIASECKARSPALTVRKPGCCLGADRSALASCRWETVFPPQTLKCYDTFCVNLSLIVRLYTEACAQCSPDVRPHPGHPGRDDPVPLLGRQMRRPRSG
jgi:hypothetical protein